MKLELTKLTLQVNKRDGEEIFLVEFTINGTNAQLKHCATLNKVVDTFKLTKSEVKTKIYKYSYK